METNNKTKPLELSGALYRQIAQSTYDWESLFDTNGQIMWVNPAVERITGYRVEECMAMGDFPLPMVFENDRTLMREILQKAQTGQSGNDIAFRVVRKNGDVFWASISWQSMIGKNGHTGGVRTSIRDISARKDAEQAMQKALEDVQRANDAKSRFLAAASHDLRQPLHAVRMFTSTLKLVLKGNNEALTLVDNIGEGLDASQEILNALLDISRLEAGMMTPEISEFPVQDCIAAVAQNAAPLAQEKGLKLRVRHCPETIKSDSALLTRALRNIVFNAMRYTTRGGVLLGCRKRGETLCICVYDTGQGIDDAELNRIFEEFYQIGNPERDRRRGLGLGLAIVKRITQLLGHEITVYSVPGKGSCFMITVPLATTQKKRRKALAKNKPASRLTGLTLMAIDDDPLQLNALSGLLRKLGADTMRATGPGEALALLRKTNYQPDMVIADLRLRGKATGIDAVKLVRRELGENIPALIITGDTAPDRLREANAAGLELLHKPVTGEQLATAVRNMLAMYL